MHTVKCASQHALLAASQPLWGTGVGEYHMPENEKQGLNKTLRTTTKPDSEFGCNLTKFADIFSHHLLHAKL